MLRRWPTPLYSPPDDGGAAPAAGSGGGAAHGSPPPDPPAADVAPPARPDWVPESFWDAKAGLKADDFGKHYGELATFHKTETEKRAALPAKPEDYKLELKLPDTVKVPEGLNLGVNEKDPRVPLVRALAHKYGMPQEAVNDLVAVDAQMQIEAIAAANARIEAEQKKLGEKFPERKAAVESFLKGAFTGSEEQKNAKYDALALIIGDAAAFEAVEDLIARAVKTGVPPTTHDNPPPKPPEKPLVQTLFPKRFGPNGELLTRTG
jgi:hypothetical protein